LIASSQFLLLAFLNFGALPGFDDLISISITTGVFEKLKKECIIEM